MELGKLKKPEETWQVDHLREELDNIIKVKEETQQILQASQTGVELVSSSPINSIAILINHQLKLLQLLHLMKLSTERMFLEKGKINNFKDQYQCIHVLSAKEIT